MRRKSIFIVNRNHIKQKEMSKKKNNNDKLQVGNFMLKRESNKMGEFMAVKALNGQWQMRWGDGCLMYGHLLRMMQEKDESNLHALFFLLFATTSCMHSTEFYLGLNKLIVEELDAVPEEKQPTEKEEEEALKEVQEMTELQDELEQIEKEENGTA